MEFRKFFPERLRELRKNRGETQQQVANGLGLLRQHYQKFEAGDNLPSLEKFLVIADYFEVSLDYLAGRTDVKKTQDPGDMDDPVQGSCTPLT